MFVLDSVIGAQNREEREEKCDSPLTRPFHSAASTSNCLSIVRRLRCSFVSAINIRRERPPHTSVRKTQHHDYRHVCRIRQHCTTVECVCERQHNTIQAAVSSLFPFIISVVHHSPSHLSSLRLNYFLHSPIRKESSTRLHFLRQHTHRSHTA